MNEFRQEKSPYVIREVNIIVSLLFQLQSHVMVYQMDIMLIHLIARSFLSAMEEEFTFEAALVALNGMTNENIVTGQLT